MDGALREDVNGENWLFVRDLEMVSNMWFKATKLQYWNVIQAQTF